MNVENLDDIYELSPTQQGILFHALHASEPGVYFEQFCWAIEGQLNILAFQQSWQQAIDRHAILRTAFCWQGLEKPYQVVYRQVSLSWEQLDWQTLPQANHDRLLTQFQNTDRDRGFELDRPPLMRLTLIQRSEYAYYVVWSHHHLLLDGWSMAQLLKEVLIGYEANCQRQHSQQYSLTLPNPRPYRDYILWLQQQSLDAAEAFWRKTLSGFTTPTSLKFVRSGELNENKSLRNQSQHAEQQIELSNEFTNALRSFAQSHQLTLGTIIQAAWALLLSQYSGETDVVYGLVVAGRPATLPGVESMIGMFINTLPVRVYIPPDQEIRSWLNQLHHYLVEVRSYEYTPLVNIQQWSEVPAKQPLFDSIVVIENYPVDAAMAQRVGSLKIEKISTFERTNYPLALKVVPQANLLHLEYDQNCFDEHAIARLLIHLQTVLEVIIAQPEQRLNAISCLSEAEQHRVLVEWNQTRHDNFHQSCIHHHIEAIVHRFADKTAVSSPSSKGYDSSLTYAELNQKANQLAHHLQSLGVAPDICIGLYMQRSPELIVAMLAILKAGGAYVPIDPSYPSERVAFILADLSLSIILTQSAQRATLPPHSAQTVCIDTEWDTIAHYPADPPPSTVTPDHLAYIIYTSGSTGQPKGVMVPHRSVANFIRAAQRTYEFTSDDRILQFASSSFDAAVEEIFPGLLQGATLVLRTEDMLVSYAQFWQACRDWQLTVLDLPTAVWHQLTDALAASPVCLPDCLRLMIVGGEKASPERLTLWWQHAPASIRLVNSYGPTETTVVATVCDLSKAQIGRDGETQNIQINQNQINQNQINQNQINQNQINQNQTNQNQTNQNQAGVPIGRPLDNVQIYVLNSRMQPVPIGVPGELYIGGLGVARGYFDRPELTAERFVPHLFSSEPGARLYRTGDRVRYLPDGTLEYLDRVDYQVKLRGFRIELGEIETTIAQHPAIQTAIVQCHNAEQAYLIAYIVPIADATEAITPQALKQWLQQRLPNYMIPTIILALDALPLTPSGKVDRQSLPSPQLTSDQQSFVAPRTATEEQLTQLWAEVLKLERVSCNDNFFDLGGHSLLITQLLSQVQARFQVDISLQALFNAPTVASLAQVIDRALHPNSLDGTQETQYPIETRSTLDLRAEAILDHALLDLLSHSRLNSRPLTEPKHIFLTGATGFLGAFLLFELLQQPHAIVHCLVRAADPIAGYSTIQNRLESYQLWQDSFQSRIIPVVGDLAQPLLGLSNPEFHTLAHQIDRIYHNGAWVNHTLPYSQLKSANVLGTQEVLRLACLGQIKPVHFISTTSVFSPPVQEGIHIVSESDRPEAYPLPTNGYAQSKWVAEMLLHQAGERGLPVTIYRPGRISGHSQTGAFNANDFLYRLIIGCIQLGYAPIADLELDLIPVDYVSQAIVHLSNQLHLLNQAFHLVQSDSLSVPQLVHYICEFGYSVQCIDYEQWRTKLVEITDRSPEHPLYPLLPFFFKSTPAIPDSKHLAKLKFDDRHTADALTDKLVCPIMDAHLIHTYLAYLIQQNYLPSPSAMAPSLVGRGMKG
jgi:surfactin family lipopeptide synthetase C